jgi:hypothetical protein
MIVIMIEDIINCLKFNQSILIFSFIVKLRKEADDIGPAAELDHWKQRMAKFNRYVSYLSVPYVMINELTIIIYC